MNILFVMESPFGFNNGCWFYRNHIPANALKSKGHIIRFCVVGEIPEQLKQWPHTVVFSRIYSRDPMPLLREFKRLGKKVVYELDDDLWAVAEDNPAVAIRDEKKRQYELLIKEADAITTTNDYLANKIKKINNNVYICPNAIDYDIYLPRRKDNETLIIGYSGASSHYADLIPATEALIDLQAKYKFKVCWQGLTTPPLESEMYFYQKVNILGVQPEKKTFFDNALKWYELVKQLDYFHIPFHFPELFPEVLKRCNFDIGICPVLDTEFNKSKSCIKYYEYASVGTPTLASDCAPYNREVSYRCKNTKEDWYKKLEKLITDADFREKLAQDQYKWVRENRSIRKIVDKWEEALDPGYEKTTSNQNYTNS